MYKISFKKSFVKDLAKLPSTYDAKIKKLFNKIKLNPYEKSVKLKGSDKIYRLRLGDYTLLYKVDNKEKIILVLAIDHRKNIYKKFYSGS